MFGKKKHRLLIWSVIISGLLIVSCGGRTPEDVEGFVIQGNTQGTTYTIILAEQDIHFTKTEIDSVLASFDTVLSTYIPTSVISQINASEEGFSCVDRTGFFQSCYTLSQEVYEASSGTFDPSVFPLVSGWGFFKKLETPLSQHEVDSICQFVSFEPGKLHTATFSKDSIVVAKKDSRFMLDFNAIAQGYSVDVLHDFMTARGHRNFYVEIGGEIRVSGKNREREDWRIGIDTPQENQLNTKERKISGIISISDKAVATSGNYRNFYEKDGKKYAHTLDPLTGFPVQHNLLSATVIADNCAIADAYATVCMVIGTEKAKELVKTLNPRIEVVLISEEQGGYEIYTSPGAADLLDGK